MYPSLSLTLLLQISHDGKTILLKLAFLISGIYYKYYYQEQRYLVFLKRQILCIFTFGVLFDGKDFIHLCKLAS